MATRLGLTSFGGPVAHIGYFREEYVVRRRWLDDRTFADLLALSQLLPGPASSQLGIAIGALRAGPLGGLLAWVGFTLPSAAALVAFAYGVRELDADAGWLGGLEVAAVAVVAWALVGMARLLTPDLRRALVAVAAAAVALAWRGVGGQLAAIAVGALAGVVVLRALRVGAPVALGFAPRRRIAVAALALFAGLLGGLPLLREAVDSHAVALVDALYRAGSLVFGGGHVVLPLLHAETVRPGWLSDESFVAGYGAAQAVPGPLFTFAAYVGAAGAPEPNGVSGGALALGAIFLPSFLLLAAALPLWDAVRSAPGLARVLAGVNAAVVGLLLAAFWDPVLTTGIGAPADAALAVALLAALASGRVPAWLVVALGALGGAGLAALGLT